MASVTYDNKAIIPAPLVTITKTYRAAGGGEKHGVMYDISLAGTLLPFRGSPGGNYPFGDPSNAFAESSYPSDEAYVGGNTPFVRLERKQEALRWLFREDGKLLEWQGAPESPVKCHPKVLSINFPEGQWVDRCEYRIELEAEYLIGVDNEDIFDVSGLQDVSEDWQFNEVAGHDSKVYEISHIVSAQGILTFDPEIQGWLNAKNWCVDRITDVPDDDFVKYATDFDNWINGGYTKSTNVSERDGSYAITETWIICEAGPSEIAQIYMEKSFNVIHRTKDDAVDVSYNGTIYGLSEQEHTGGSLAVAFAKTAVPSNSGAKIATETALGVLLEGYIIPISPTQKNIVVNEKDAIVTFGFDWSASEYANYTQGNEATISYNSSDGVHTLVLNVDIEGNGDTKADRLKNARDNIPSDASGLILARNLIGSQRPTEVQFSGSHISKSSALNETQGTSRVSWTWTDRAENNVDITIETVYPQTITAKISIPGRATGPIIQQINTFTAKQITVTYSSEGHEEKPTALTIENTMDEKGSIKESYILENDRETWNEITGKYTRVRTHTVTED